MSACLSVYAEEGKVTDLFSLDLSYSRIGLENNGWGLGVAYEKVLINHLALKAGFGHMTFKTSIDDIYCTTVNLSLFTNYYFLNEDLRNLYCGVGLATDFLNYFGSGVLPDKTDDTITYLCSILGWKYYIFQKLLLDLNIGYNLIISDARNYPNFDKYGKSGFQYSVSIKIFKSNRYDRDKMSLEQ